MSTGGSAPPDGGAFRPAIDRSVLGDWLAGDDTAIDELLRVFRDSICAEQVRLREMLAMGDLAEYAQAAHRLRGAALAMGARAVANAAGILQAAAREQKTDLCLGGLAMLATEVQLMSREVPPEDETPG